MSIPGNLLNVFYIIYHMQEGEATMQNCSQYLDEGLCSPVSIPTLGNERKEKVNKRWRSGSNPWEKKKKECWFETFRQNPKAIGVITAPS